MTNKQRDVGDEEQVKLDEAKAELASEREVDDFRRVLATSEGRAIIWRMLAYCGLYDDPPTHPQDTFRAIGRQDVGRWLIKEVFTSDPSAYKLMWQEAEERNLEGIDDG